MSRFEYDTTPVPGKFGIKGGATEKQVKFIEDLITKKELDEDQIAWVKTNLPSFTKKKASEVIERLMALKDKPKEQQQSKAALMQVPSGRYAIDNREGELRFYQVWESRDKEVKRVYVMHGPYESKLPYDAQKAIAEEILRQGVRECAIRYGNEIGSCSNCGRRLTNRISRELGIGPICGGRMFDSDNWKQEVADARQRIIDRGENPEEELSE